jgi:hypothetical protein
MSNDDPKAVDVDDFEVVAIFSEATLNETFLVFHGMCGQNLHKFLPDGFFL